MTNSKTNQDAIEINDSLVRHLIASQFPKWKTLPIRAVSNQGWRAWTLWKFLIVAAGLTSWNATEASRALHIIDEVISEHKILRSKE